jgi:hypothetical protein
MQRALIGITLLFMVGAGYGALSAATPHDYAQDAYRAHTLRERATTSQAVTPADVTIAKSKESILPIKNKEKEAPVPNQIATVPDQKPATRHSFTAQRAGTVLNIMDAQHASGFMFTTKNYPALGAFVESINGLENKDGKYWILYVNGATSTLGVSQALVMPGDTVEWRYEDSY